MHFPRQTLVCCARWRIAMGDAHHQRNCWRAASAGGHGAPMRRCICGPPPFRNPSCLEKPMNAKPPENFGLDRLQTPIGTALLVTDAGGVLRALDWEEFESRMRE